MTKIPRKLSLVRFDGLRLPRGFRSQYPFRAGVAYVFLGEIPKMPDHCVVAGYKSGKSYAGYHTDHFVELSKDEVGDYDSAFTQVSPFTAAR